jgi:N-acetylmuramoyl-L-alanine amidase
MMIAIAFDAGHPPLGCQSPDGLLVEHVLTLAVCTRAAAILSRGRLVRPVLVRETEAPLHLDERGPIAQRSGASAVVSVHFNWAYDARREGAELFYRRGDDTGRALGAEIMGALPQTYEWRAWPADDRWPGAVAVLGAYAPIPTALCELAFLSSPLDCAWLRKPESLDVLAGAVAAGCASWARMQTKEI